MEIDAALYPNITELYRAGWRIVEANRGGRHFKVTIHEKLGDPEPPLFFASYDEKIELEIDHERRSLWAEADLPREAAHTPEECMHAALTRLNGP